MIAESTIYTTSDGRIFRSREDAENWEKLELLRLAMVEKVGTYAAKLPSLTQYDIVRWAVSLRGEPATLNTVSHVIRCHRTWGSVAIADQLLERFYINHKELKS